MSGYLGHDDGDRAGLQLPGVRLEGLGAARRHDARGGRLVRGAPDAAVRRPASFSRSRARRRSGRRRGSTSRARPSRPSRRPRRAARAYPIPTERDDSRRRRDRSDRAVGRRRRRVEKAYETAELDVWIWARLGHLTYSTLVHPGDNWEQMWHSLRTYRAAGEGASLAERAVRRVLRLAAPSAEVLVEDSAARDELKRFLADQDLYLYTVNAFVYGVFKRHASSRSRSTSRTGGPKSARNTRCNVADILADIAPGGDCRRRFRPRRSASSRG